MKKTIVSVIMALIFTVSVVGTGMAAYVNCKITAIDAETKAVTMTCKKIKKMKVGDTVKVKKAKKGGAVEGC